MRTIEQIRSAETWKGMALWAERKADEAAASEEPRALGKLRTYQNYASQWWAEHFKAKREEEQCEP